MLSRKHYIEVAKILADSDLSQEARRSIAKDLADYFKGDNARFDRDRFMTAACPDAVVVATVCQCVTCQR